MHSVLSPDRGFALILIRSSLFSAIVVQLLCQLFKVVFYSIKDRRLEIGYLFSAGGMPSAHSAFVTTLTVSLGLRNGFISELFAVAFVFSMIIIYDSLRLRGTVQIHSLLLQRLLAHFPEEADHKVPQMVGHSILEVIVGIAAGAVFAVMVYFIFC